MLLKILEDTCIRLNSAAVGHSWVFDPGWGVGEIGEAEPLLALGCNPEI